MSAAAFLGVRTGTFNRQIVGFSWGVTLLVFSLYFIPFTSDHKAFSAPQTHIRSHIQVTMILSMQCQMVPLGNSDDIDWFVPWGPIG